MPTHQRSRALKTVERTPPELGVIVGDVPEDDDEGGGDDSGILIAERIRDAVSAGERVYVRVFKKLEDGGWAACRDYTPEDVLTGDLSVIRDEFGPGLYELRVTSRSGYLARPKVTLAPSMKPAPTVEAAQKSEASQMLAALFDGQQALMQRLANPPPPPPAPPPPPTLLQQLGVSSLGEALAIAGTLKGLFTNPTPAATGGALSPIEQIKQVLEVKRLLREDEPGGEPKEESLIGMLPQFLEVLKTGMQPPQSAGLPAVSLPGSIATAHDTVPQAPSTQQARQSVEDDIKACMDRAFSMLSEKADPSAIGDYLYEYLPDEAFPVFSMPNWFELLCTYAPQFKSHQGELIQAHAQIMQRVERAKNA